MIDDGENGYYYQITIGLEKIVICDQKNSSDCFPYLNVKYYPYFKFEINSKVISDFSNKDSVNWIPTEPGTYEIKVIGRDDNGNTDISTRTIVVEDKIVFPKIVISPNAPYYVGTPLTISLVDKDLTSQEKSYKYFKYEVNSKVVSDYYEAFKLAVSAKIISVSYTNMSVTWTPTKVGSYSIPVPIIDAAGNITTKNIQIKIENPKK